MSDPPWDLVMNVVATLHSIVVLDRAGLFAGAADTELAYARGIEMVVAMLEREGRNFG